jgi:hypothetical protein
MPGPVEMLFILASAGSIFVTYKIIRLRHALRAYKRGTLHDEGYSAGDLQISEVDARHMNKNQAMDMAHINLVGLLLVGALCYALLLWIVGVWLGWLPDMATSLTHSQPR